MDNVTVAHSSGSQELDQAAVECASSWTYRPAQKNGRPVEVPWQAEVNWMLR